MVAQLIYDEKTDRMTFDGIGLHCGELLSVYVYDGLTSSFRWEHTRIEYNGSWYLVGLVGYQVNGLFAKMEP